MCSIVEIQSINVNSRSQILLLLTIELWQGGVFEMAKEEKWFYETERRLLDIRVRHKSAVASYESPKGLGVWRPGVVREVGEIKVIDLRKYSQHKGVRQQFWLLSGALVPEWTVR